MPHTQSAKKHIRQSEKRRLRNRAIKKDIKLQIKKLLVVVQEGNVEQARQELKLAAKKLDRAAAKCVLHANTVARKKSQLARLLNAKATAGKATKG
jgi:small subunit ribosomal protein S20